MEIPNNVLVEKAAGIIKKSGMQALTIQNLVRELNVNEKDLNKQLSGIDDLVLLILNDFEGEFTSIIEGLKSYENTPAAELNNLFKKLYSLFLQKPYYLDIIFENNLVVEGEKVRVSILRIKNLVGNYLTSLIEKGKQAGKFRNTKSTKNLVNSILAEFKLIMQDEQLYIKAMRDLKLLKN